MCAVDPVHRLRDSARLEASPMRAAAASPTPVHSSSSSKVRPPPGSLVPASGTGSSSIADIAGPAALQKLAGGISSSSGGGWGIQAALETVGSAVEGIPSHVAEGLDTLDSFAAEVAGAASSAVQAGRATGAAAAGDTAAGDDESALDFVSDFPQLFPAAVMSEVVQRHSTAGALPALSGAGPNGSGSGGGGVVNGIFSLTLPGVWRVESLHQMLRSVSPERDSKA